MIPAGYMAKQVAVRPDWLKAGRVSDIYSVSYHESDAFIDFVDFVNLWKHNGYWFFDSPQIILEIAQQKSLDLTNIKLFYYEIYEIEFIEESGQWTTFTPDSSIKTQVLLSAEKTLEGFDIVTYSEGDRPECSPLSCNSLASEVETNEHCLLPSLEIAKKLLEMGKFNNSEPGPFRVFAVYSIKWPLKTHHL